MATLAQVKRRIAEIGHLSLDVSHDGRMRSINVDCDHGWCFRPGEHMVCAAAYKGPAAWWAETLDEVLERLKGETVEPCACDECSGV